MPNITHPEECLSQVGACRVGSPIFEGQTASIAYPFDMGTLLAACVVHALLPDDGAVGTTAIDKRAVDGPVRVRRLGLYADVQADRKHHGGEEQAVYAYAQEDAVYWGSELDRPLDSGWFGENLRVEGVDVSGARVGERWRIGGEDGVVLEVTGARMPCQTFARWLGGDLEKGWVKLFTIAGRPGAYLKVVKQGQIAAGDSIEVVTTAPEAPSVRQLLWREA
jgi:MOSC domain-containing protein YiiM